VEPEAFSPKPDSRVEVDLHGLAYAFSPGHGLEIPRQMIQWVLAHAFESMAEDHRLGDSKALCFGLKPISFIWLERQLDEVEFPLRQPRQSLLRRSHRTSGA
jgi:hypothetical protein